MTYCIECGKESGHLTFCEQWTPTRPKPVYRYTTPTARSTDPDTSHAAAASIANVTDAQQTVLNLLSKHGPLTDLELAFRHADDEAEPISPSGLRTRRAELTEQGLVVDTGERRLSPSGRSCVVWGTR